MGAGGTGGFFGRIRYSSVQLFSAAVHDTMIAIHFNFLIESSSQPGNTCNIRNYSPPARLACVLKCHVRAGSRINSWGSQLGLVGPVLMRVALVDQ